MLKIEDLWVEVAGREVLKGINLEIPSGETHALFGRNGSGKTTLLMTIMGFAGYKVKHGRIFFKGEDITDLPPYERARRGIGILFQRPPTLRGVKLRDMLTICSQGRLNPQELALIYGFDDFLDRDVNLGFSGGEIKKSELLQLLAQNPDLVLLDEPESGVDMENLQVIGQMIRRLLEKDVHRRRTKSGLIITHTGFILNYVTADRGYVMLDGQIYCHGNPLEIFEGIQKHGYEECLRCLRRI
ncbi:ABC transporter ATP-binding protein [Thermosulfuriphilus ammonigenes]|uniref:ABC transporter ATP-binding protein n=1 Tax=Thermosulfuriphilus ammonigenes TaxID=1936021 RepID=A0A6G7PV16_9BACT|nr:ABC transporter ATP-binding protein [Thermosulfuriphilus ammonigenes]MBA2848340.1 Fe-S cluster assembly ATP-binding protein [Thermosulfuriphilus ammonigenes]QIJ71502.1 ABC transporter ATP-binding protein [Thermosulfuriphilus ammonigenes]HFB83445.1 ABC transporter ATP-binding protein [Thermodesulfatator sp.]